MKIIQDWYNLAQAGTKIVALEYYQADLPDLLVSFKYRATELNLSVYYWNIGYSYVQEVQVRDNQFTLFQTNLEIDEQDILLFLYDSQLPGIFLLDDCQNVGNDKSQSPQCYQAKLSNLFWQYQGNKLEQYVVILGEELELGNKLTSLIPKLKYSLPQLREVADIVTEFIQANLSDKLAENIELSQQSLVRACQGLSKGEIKLILQRYGGLNHSSLELAELVINYKQQKLQSEG